MDQLPIHYFSAPVNVNFLDSMKNVEIPFFLVEIDSTMIGLTLVYCLQLGGLFQWCVRQSAQVENLVSFNIVVFMHFLKNDTAPEVRGPDKIIKSTNIQ